MQFQLKGIATSFSIRALANRCELTNAGLLHYFGSKEKLLVALLAERAARDSGATHHLFEGTPTDSVQALEVVRMCGNCQ